MKWINDNTIRTRSIIKRTNESHQLEYPDRLVVMEYDYCMLHESLIVYVVNHGDEEMVVSARRLLLLNDLWIMKNI